MGQIGESHVEEAALAWLAELGYATVNGLTIGPDAMAPERASYGDVMLVGRLNAALRRLNPTLPEEEVTAAAHLPPDGRVKGDRAVCVFCEFPPGPLIFKEGHMKCLPAATRAEHNDKPNMRALADQIDSPRVKSVWYLFHSDSP